VSKLESHSAIYLAGRVGPAAINLLATAVYTRISTPDQYSYLVIANASAQLGSAALFQWLRMSLLRMAAETTPERLLGTLATLYLAQSAVVVLLALLVRPWFQELPGGNTVWAISTVMLLAQAWFDFTQEVQRSSLLPVNYSLTFASRSVLSLILGTTALLLTGSGALLAASVAAAILISPFFFNGGVFRIRPVFDRKLAGAVLRYGWPLCIAMLLTSLTTMGDRFVVAHFLDAHAVGAYGPSSDFAKQTVFVLAQSISLAGFPLVLRTLADKGEAEAKEQLRQNFGMTFFVTASACTCLAALSGPISMMVFGPEFRESATALLPVVAAGSFAMCMRMFYFDQILQIAHATREQTVVGVILTGTSFALFFVLIPRFGILGAAVAGAAGQWVGLLASIEAGRRRFPTKIPVGSTARIALACAVTIFASTLYQHYAEPTKLPSSVLTCALTGVIFLASCAALKVPQALFIAKKIIRKIK